MLLPFTATLVIVKPLFGVMVNVWFAPLFTVTLPDGVILPPLPAVAVIVRVITAALTVIVKSCVKSVPTAVPLAIVALTITVPAVGTFKVFTLVMVAPVVPAL